MVAAADAMNCVPRPDPVDVADAEDPANREIADSAAIDYAMERTFDCLAGGKCIPLNVSETGMPKADGMGASSDRRLRRTGSESCGFPDRRGSESLRRQN